MEVNNTYHTLDRDAGRTYPALDLFDDHDRFVGYDDDQDRSSEEGISDSGAGGPSRPSRVIGALRHRPVLLAMLLVSLIVLTFGGFRLRNYIESYESTDDAQVDAHISPISSRISGTITGVYVEDNQRVKAGQLLVQFDVRDYQVAVEQARAQLAQASADVNSARQQYASALAKIGQARARNYEAQRDQQRYSTLLRLGVVSQAEYDQYHANAGVQNADVQADQADAASAWRTIASREAQLKAAQARLDQAILNLGYTRITAPADGIIGKRTGELGQRVDPGQSLMALTQVNDLWVTANFKETQLARMHRGQPVTIHVDALGRDFDGRVQSMPGATGSLYSLLPPENATGNYVKVVQRLPVRIVFDPGQNLSRLRPGMSVEPSIWLN
ncbi:MAG TPA: HlyD family secretion protein [Candidatus Binataceae bacterium]|nr:HlyD family secretion protein [Candidatus Binataceae bacterium]